jgi:hypothetical protein
MAFVLYFKDDGKKEEKKPYVFSLYYLLPDLMCHILLHEFHIQSVSFQMVSRICISLLQVLSSRQLDLGLSFWSENEKKGSDPNWSERSREKH